MTIALPENFSFPFWIAVVLKLFKLTSKELSIKSGVPLGTLNKILAGQTDSLKVETLNKIRKTSTDLSVELGRMPTKDEIAYRLGITVSKLGQLISQAQETVSIETPTNQKEESSILGDFIVDEESISPDLKVTQENMFGDIRKILNQLSPKERDVLIMRYGLNEDGQKKTLEEIGNRYGVSRERIRQIENRAISKLKKLCNNYNLTKGLKNYFS